MEASAPSCRSIFGVFHLLGFQFSPRIAAIGGARFRRVDGKVDDGLLDDLAANRINTKLIVEPWDDLLRLVGSLNLGVGRMTGLAYVLHATSAPKVM